MTTLKTFKSAWPQGLVALILVLVPFHAVITTWAGSNFGHIDVFRIWKEILLLPLTTYAFWRLAYTPSLAKKLTNSPLFWCGLAYGLLTLLLGIVAWQAGRVNSPALLFGLVINLRFLWFMLIVWVVCDGHDWLRQHWLQVVLIPASLVIAFGLLQRFVLPPDVLRHVGYGPNTIPAVQTVDQKLTYRRVQSTLRGANPLGAYLVAIMIALAISLVNRWRLYLAGGLLAGATVLLFFSYSRSAWLGVMAGSLLLVWLKLPGRRWRQAALVATVVMAVLTLAGVWSLRHNDFVQNTLFHADEHSQSAISSNQGRSNALQTGVRDVMHEPLGRGPGTAGPASARNHRPARISENYYLQVGQETGWLGLGLFVVINLLLANRLWCGRGSLNQILLASLVGLTVVNMLSHAWTDDTVAMLYWGLAGLALAHPD